MDREELREMRRDWAWFVGVGSVLLVLGILAISLPLAATITVAATVGWVLVIAGIIQAINTFENREHGGFWLSLMGAALKLAIGAIVIANPAGSAIALVMVGAAYLLVSGLFRTFAALEMRFPRWGWAAFSGILAFALGLLLLAQWPVSGLYALGLFVGIDLIVDGLAFMLLGLRARNLRTEQ